METTIKTVAESVTEIATKSVIETATKSVTKTTLVDGRNAHDV